jgi:hypothetical protein
MTTAAWHDLFVPTLIPDAPAGHVRMRADVLPSKVFGSNVRSIARWSEWERIRLAVAARAGNLCQICGGESHGPYGKVQRPDCHEIWRFEERDNGLTQVLAGLIALCKACHNTQHVGRAPDLDQVMEVLMDINGWTREEARDDLRRAFARVKLLDDVEIHLDLSLLIGQIDVLGAPALLFTAADRAALGPSWKPSGPATRSPTPK